MQTPCRFLYVPQMEHSLRMIDDALLSRRRKKG